MAPEQLPDAPTRKEITQPTTTQSTSESTQKTSNPPKLHEFSIRKPDWAYIHLKHLSPPNKPNQAALDGVTAQLHITAALSAFLGLHGTAVPIDILKLEGQEVWIRVLAQDRAALIAAVGGWTNRNHDGWRVKGWSHWSAAACGQKEHGQELFD